MTTAEKKLDTARALDRLREMLPPGSTVYTVLRTRARSGMSRTMTVHAVVDGSIVNLTGYVGNALDMKRNADYALRVNGCGFDAGHHLAYELSHVLYPDRDRSGYTLRHEWI